MYSNNIVNFQESMTILNACTKKLWKLIECTTNMQVVASVSYGACVRREEAYIYVHMYVYMAAYIDICLCGCVYVCVSTYMHLCIYPLQPPRASGDTRSILKRSTAGLNSNFSFS